MKKKKHYYYAFNLTNEGMSGVKEDWGEVSNIIKGKKATYKKFLTKEEAESWLDMGADYKNIPKRNSPLIHEGALYSY